MGIATGVRIGWRELPAEVRRAVEEIIGAPVVEAVSQPGGFSPGTADRVRAADGRRAFVKAVSPAQNDRSPGMHRREGEIAAALPDSAPAPRLLGRHDDGYWVALVFEDVEGRHPATPWRPDELELVLAALRDLAGEGLPPSLAHLPEVRDDQLGEDFRGWDRVLADPPAELDPWVARHLDELVALGTRGVAAMTGDTLVHSDLRADNLLITPEPAVVLVDWPWACRGPAWLDSVLLLINVRLFGGHDTPALLARCADGFGADPLDLIAVLAAAAGYFTDVARRPPPPGLPTVRRFQRLQGEALLGWLREDAVFG